MPSTGWLIGRALWKSEPWAPLWLLWMGKWRQGNTGGVYIVVTWGWTFANTLYLAFCTLCPSDAFWSAQVLQPNILYGLHTIRTTYYTDYILYGLYTIRTTYYTDYILYYTLDKVAVISFTLNHKLFLINCELTVHPDSIYAKMLLQTDHLRYTRTFIWYT